MHRVSERALVCPRCGEPLRDRHARAKWLLLVLVAIVGLGALADPGCRARVNEAGIDAARRVSEEERRREAVRQAEEEAARERGLERRER